MTKFLRRLKHLIKSTVSYVAYHLKNGGDYDWDSHYLYTMMSWKLARIAKCISEGDIIEGAQRVKKQINYAVWLIDQITSDAVSESAVAEHRKIYGSLVVDWSNDETKGNHRIRRFSYSKATTPEAHRKAEAVWRQMHLDTERREKDLKRRLFRHMERYIHRWWD